METHGGTTTQNAPNKQGRLAMVKVLLLAMCFSSLVQSKETFRQKEILLYFNEQNPFYYNAVGEEYISKEEETFYIGAFDTQLNMKYDDKNYPISEGEYQKVNLVKPFENGIELTFGYRNAQGIQEYNNIKTSNKGEMLTGIKVPLFSAIHNISKNQVDLKTSKLNTKRATQGSRLNLLSLYLRMSAVYYQMLFQKAILDTEKALLYRTQKNYDFIDKEVETGNLAQIALIEIESQVIDRKERQLNAFNDFRQVKNIFLQYLNISEKVFDSKYTLPQLPQNLPSVLSLTQAQGIAIENRPEFKEIRLDMEKVYLQKEYNALAQYPNVDFNLQGVYDLEYQEGYKVSIDFSYPLERNQYKGREEALRKQILLLDSAKQKILSQTKTKIKNILQKIEIKKKAIALLRRELFLVEQLTDMETTKYQQGSSHLMFLNQREMKTLHTKQKLFKSYYDLKIMGMELEYELGNTKKLRHYEHTSNQSNETLKQLHQALKKSPPK
ncbi:MAG: hypothetical protein GQ531_02560 [Sulfurovum sp.]|nr:hypothetical protein [Sulfurovum sp.]